MPGPAIGRRLLICCVPFVALWFFFSNGSLYAEYRLGRENHRSEFEIGSKREGHDDRVKDGFSWDSILPTEELIWTDCYAGQQCARLKVPLDYTHPDGASAAIAMIRTHSAVPHDSPSYRGPVLINPGGPGESGVDTVAKAGPLLSAIVGPEFDIVGFDPRGVSRSTPRMSFFASRAERRIWYAEGASVQRESMNSSVDALARAYARGMLVGQLAGKQDDGSLRFMNTDHTARDMLKIVQAHGRDKLQYWGFSYGSVLGATFASMFPQNVGRLVIDGVVDAENYFATKWSNNLLDADKAWMTFANGCVAAGPNGCALYAPTAADIMEKVDKIYASVRARPIPVRSETSFALVDWTMVRATVFESLYTPYALFPILARALAELHEGNGTALFRILEEPTFECACDPARYQFEHLPDATPGILCNDGKRISPEYEDVLAHYQNLRETSSWADVWEPIRLPCLAWPEFPKDHFQGLYHLVARLTSVDFKPTQGHSWLTQVFHFSSSETLRDPVTPLSAAKKMSQGFAGSVVLTQDSPGHCSIASVSLCTYKYIRQYFLNGTLPEPGTVCPVDVPLFPSSSDFAGEQDEDEVQTSFTLSAADRGLFEAAKTLAQTRLIRFPRGI
ncbi:Abhydrolase-4 domain-containing protein [Mycena sanguinolenta]|uniref:Abhydrolase-4 domain-containing protein n=1 Tax=Mycena sanguinolenta TaxID=230812 RepID=A0A8H6YC00_9AGAR|nr:Abhydrolase-4 domain-containing protein [Mycena sanguinolenta]